MTIERVFQTGPARWPHMPILTQGESHHGLSRNGTGLRRTRLVPRVKSCSRFVPRYHRAMSWTEDQLERLKSTVAQAGRQGVLISAAEARLVRSLIWTIRRLTRSQGYNGSPEGHLPTVADTKAEGIENFHVWCLTPECGVSRKFRFDQIELPDALPFIDIPRHRRFVCSRCRKSNVRVMALRPYDGMRPPREG